MRQLMLLFGTEGNRIRFSDPRSYCRNKIEFPLHTQRMGIFKALGLGIAIVVLKLLMPDVFSGLEGARVQDPVFLLGLDEPLERVHRGGVGAINSAF